VGTTIIVNFHFFLSVALYCETAASFNFKGCTSLCDSVWWLRRKWKIGLWKTGSRTPPPRKHSGSHMPSPYVKLCLYISCAVLPWPSNHLYRLRITQYNVNASPCFPVWLRE
jgi:hypothetical protein